MTDHPNRSAESCDLKPCPFCGGEAGFYENWVDRERKWSVSCGDCGANLDVCEDTKTEAAARWNARTFSDAQPTVKSGILTLDVEGWILSVRVHDGGYEVSITEDGKCPASHYVRLDHEQADTLRDFMVETSPATASLAEAATAPVLIATHASEGLPSSDAAGAGAVQHLSAASEVDALRWRQLPAHLAEFQIDYVGLKRAIDADLADPQIVAALRDEPQTASDSDYIEKLKTDIAFCREAMRHADIDLSMVLPLVNADMQKEIRKTLARIDEAKIRSLSLPRPAPQGVRNS